MREFSDKTKEPSPCLTGLSDEDITYTYDVKGNIASVSFSRTVTEPDPEPTPTPTPPPTPTPTPEPTPTPTPDPTPTPEPPLVTMDPVIPIRPTPTPPGEIMSGGNGGSGSSTSSTTTITVTIYYEYDALNELVWEKSELEEKAWHYSYDLGGNILSKTEYSYQNGTVGGTPLSTVSYTYGDSDWPDLLTVYNGSPITYDGMGNPTSYRGWTFTWQGGRQLAAAEKGTTSLNFVYNESGLRTEKNVGNASHRYVYRGSTLVAEIADSYALYFHHDARGEIVGFTYVSGSTQAEYFYRKNLQGDVIGIVDSSGSSVAEYAYDAWGKILEATGTMAEINPIRYRGYYFDRETGLYYLQSRYYDPEVGRFINSDVLASTGQGILGCNMFAYCINNPVNETDWNGKRPWYLDIDGNPQEDGQIIYTVPCLDQGGTNCCWAYCIIMRKGYEAGKKFSPEEIKEVANSFPWIYRAYWNNNTGLPFFLQGDKADINSIEDLYECLLHYGPVYAAYIIPWTLTGHVVLVTGVDINSNRVYTNNPWYVKGVQSFSDFLNDFCPGKYPYDSRFTLYAIYTPTI